MQLKDLSKSLTSSHEQHQQLQEQLRQEQQAASELRQQGTGLEQQLQQAQLQASSQATELRNMQGVQSVVDHAEASSLHQMLADAWHGYCKVLHCQQ